MAKGQRRYSHPCGKEAPPSKASLWGAVAAWVALGLSAIVGCTWWLVHTSHESAKTTGTVTSAGSSCSISYRDLSGTFHTYYDEGGKSGCHYYKGQHVGIYYDPQHPTNTSLGSPVAQMAFAGVFIVGGLAILGASVYVARDLVSSGKRRSKHHHR